MIMLLILIYHIIVKTQLYNDLPVLHEGFFRMMLIFVCIIYLSPKKPPVTRNTGFIAIRYNNDTYKYAVADPGIQGGGGVMASYSESMTHPFFFN